LRLHSKANHLVDDAPMLVQQGIVCLVLDEGRWCNGDSTLAGSDEEAKKLTIWMARAWSVNSMNAWLRFGPTFSFDCTISPKGAASSTSSCAFDGLDFIDFIVLQIAPSSTMSRKLSCHYLAAMRLVGSQPAIRLAPRGLSHMAGCVCAAPVPATSWTLELEKR